MKYLLMAFLVIFAGCDKKIRKAYQEVRQSSIRKWRECGTNVEHLVMYNVASRNPVNEDLAVQLVNKKEEFFSGLQKNNIAFSTVVSDDQPNCQLSEEELYLNDGALNAINYIYAHMGILDRIKKKYGALGFTEIQLIVVSAKGQDLWDMNDNAEIIVQGERRILPIYINLGESRFQYFSQDNADPNFTAKLMRLGTPDEREQTHISDHGRKDVTTTTQGTTGQGSGNVNNGVQNIQGTVIIK